MNFEITGAPFPILNIQLKQGESIICQKGGMAWMSQAMTMQTSGGGLGKMFSKAISGESMFQNTYTASNGDGFIAVGSKVPGNILPIQLSDGNSIIAQKSAFLASETGVSFEMFFQKKLGAGFFGGEGFIMQKYKGNGMVFLEIDGSIIEYVLAPNETMKLDTGYLAAMESSVKIDIETVKGIGNALLGGEGFFNTVVTGPGKIWLQTMPTSVLASSIQPYIVTGS